MPAKGCSLDGAPGLCGIDRNGFDTIEGLLRGELEKARELVALS